MRLVHRDEDGVALVTAMLAGTVIILFVLASLSYALGSMPVSRHDQDWNAALAAAEAGMDDYLFRINQDGNYWTYSATTPPPDGNLAFQQYVPVPGKAKGELFRYKADSSTIATDGAVKLTSTGVINNVTRTVYATLRRRSFLDYLYFTDYETKDPALYVGPPTDPFTAAQAQTNCAKYYYQSRNSQCISIFFITADTINGPLHSNDAINISGNPQFKGPASTSWNDPAGKRWLGSGSPTFVNAGDPALLSALTMPPNNSAIQADADMKLGGTGCLYTGPTLIKFNSAGNISVTSPWSKTAGGQTAASCLPGSPGGTVNLPPNGVIYVQSVPAGDPNYAAGCPFTGGVYPPGLPVPIATDITPYGCRDGDVFVQGTLKGRLTVAADHNVYLSGDITYVAPGTAGTESLLGLIGNNYVEVMHPVSCTTSMQSSCNLKVPSRGTPFTNPNIYAAILSVQHSFRVQNYAAGSSLGSLNLVGAVSQRYRGIVGTFNGSSAVTGYAKNYVYDTRLHYLQPPRFLDPVKSGWNVATWAEIQTPATFP